MLFPLTRNKSSFPARNSRWKKRLNACYAVSMFPYSHLIMPFLLLWKLPWFSLFTESCQRNNSLSFWSWITAVESMNEFKLRKGVFSFVRNDRLAAYHFCIQVSLLPLFRYLAPTADQETRKHENCQCTYENLEKKNCNSNCEKNITYNIFIKWIINIG